MRIDIYHHYVDVSNDQNIVLKEFIHYFKQKIETIMATFEEVSAKLEAQSTVIGDVKTSLDAIETDIAGLKSQIGVISVGTFTQEQLDSLSQKADAVSAGLSALKTKASVIDDETPAVEPPPPPPVTDEPPV